MTIAACAALVERGDPDRFAAVMAAPVAARSQLFPLYAFNLEVARAPWVTQEPMIAEMRLQWWRDIAEAAVNGGPVRAHEVVGPLTEVVRETGLPGDVLDRLVEARRWDIYREPFADEAAFDAYIEDTGGGLMWLAVRALGGTEEQAARDAGWALGLANFLRAVPVLEARGRFPLVDGRPAAVAALAQRGLDRLAKARRARRDLPAAAMLATWQTGPILAQAAAEPLRVGEGRLGLSEARRRGRLIWAALTGRW
ncbi:squalene/phytoene synthase family protein [Tabrizicola sp. J26]|uniref:phytoene/squalene synthase family protein n=1 Tax=Alitabrizicola rongguiensis TaxID=2909234 RepID=UPI001F40D990|nr:squalene/phytoene synthase family protein [Tabrizicola rongguiensis]MCF1710040.1 squalene/phytoene synthase family protein [Tabrizicola rongguiensis]